MEKIIAAIDGLKYSDSAVNYAAHLARQAGAKLVGIFLDDFTYSSYKIFELIDDKGLSLEKQRKLEEKDKRRRRQAVRNFEKSCGEIGVEYDIHHDRSLAIQELLHESIYADLMVIDGKETLTHYEEEHPTRFVRDLLSEVQCPTLVVPSVYHPIRKIVLLYDGEPSSVYAIRIFSYVFPAFKELETEVLSVISRKHNLHVPDNKLMKEFLTLHYPNAAFTVLKGNAETEITKYLKAQDEGTLVVLGAYRRGMVSRWFRPSMADALMEELKAPLFITHNK